MFGSKKIGVLEHPGYNDIIGDIFGGGSSPPPAPDYTGAAIATAAGNADAARIAAKANRVSQYTPYGSITYTRPDPNDPDIWRSDVTLSPTQQQLLDSQNQISLGLGDTMNKGLGYVQNTLDNPFDVSKLPDLPVTPDVAGREEVTAALLERQQPTFQRNRAQKESDLLMRGFNPGTEGWNAAQDDLNRQENDARLAAIMAGGTEQSRLFGLGQSARERALQEESFLRNEPLNTLNAVRTGAQVTNPTFGATPNQATTQGADMLGAANQQYGAQLSAYNADQASKNNMVNGLFSLGSSWLLMP